MNRSILLFLLCILCCSEGMFAQGENNIWCFPVGTGFNFNTPTITNYPNNMALCEGHAEVSDAAGNLLFYANPQTVWDRNQNIMPNGSGIATYSTISTEDGAAIVQFFNDPNKYYLFSLEAWGSPGRLYYSVIDMSLNGGLGDVVVGQKSIQIDSGLTEKMTIAKGSGCFNWLIVHKESIGEIHAFKIDNTGLNTNPVISTSGVLTYNHAYSVGSMKVSPAGDYIAIPNYAQNGVLEIHSFNNATGVVSNCMLLDTLVYTFGAEYSADASKYYIAEDFPPGGVYQYDMTLLPNIQAVRNSRVMVGPDIAGHMRRGPDDKIYMQGTSATSVINFPNLPGLACDYVHNQVNISSGGNLGNAFVPNTGVPGYFSNTDTICNFFTSYTLSAPPGYNSYLWNDGATTQTNTFTTAGTKWVISTTGCGIRTDTFHIAMKQVDTIKSVTDTTICFVNNIPILTAAAGYNNYLWSDGNTTQQDTIGAAGTKWVRINDTASCRVRLDTFHVHAMAITSTTNVKDTNFCFINAPIILNAAAGYTSYIWSDGHTTQQDTMNNPGTKWVRAANGCSTQIDTFHVHDWRDTVLSSRDTSHCVAHSPITIYAPAGYTSYLWSDGKATQVDTFFATATKWVTATNGCNLRVDTVHFTATTIPQDSLTLHDVDTTVCFELGTVSFTAPAGYTYYLWSDGQPTQANTFTGPGTKWVYAQKLCALLTDTFTVHAMGTDTAAALVDTTVCFSGLITLSAADGYDTYLWSDGNTTQEDTFTANATRHVYAHKACAARIDTFAVRFINDLAVEIGSDTALCKGETITLNATNALYNNAVYLWQDGNTSAIYNVTAGGDYIVEVSVGPCSVRDTLRVHQKVIDIQLGNGLIPCNAEGITLDAHVDSATYLWQDGSTQRTYTATREGKYTIKVTQGLCSASKSVDVRLEGCDCHVVLPTGFSPNNDGRNDKFGATVSCAIKSYKLMIYNRWGNEVFYTEDIGSKWDGTAKGVALDGDVYNYFLEFRDGENKLYQYKGDLTLLR